ncbi:MAG TPA: putative metal-dependent hydrolase [Cytophagales bacterium]|nr:putative metal-dependent hydrolase [Cytophagales bacterium]HAA20894.1 putative metal-dependent hydrolase [Cytophagales bacterium]HAP59355.1 putative metal-dependent hydrolase [Cytophagales bacterium]
MSEKSLSYPIGEFEKPRIIDQAQLNMWIGDIATFPDRLKVMVIVLTPEQLRWVYRPGGWSIKQVVHHCADSHINSICRFKLALTEDQPTIRPYMEDRWAALPFGAEDDLDDTLMTLTGLHSRWAKLLRVLNEEQLDRTYIHPDYEEPLTVRETIGMYAWHCNHHLAHIKQALDHQGSFN